jgi:prepilin-type N-terminal cleavage/methylation domain-containing protein
MPILEAGKSKNSRRWFLSGYTLIELIVVLVIIGFVLTFSAPRFGGVLSEVRLGGAARRIGTLVKLLRDEAILNQKTYMLRYDFSKTEYWVESPEEENENGEQGGKDIKDILARRTRLPAGVSVEDVINERSGKVIEGEARIFFYPNGYVEKSTIHMKDTKEKTLSLFINPFMGNMKIVEGYVTEKEAYEGNKG